MKNPITTQVTIKAPIKAVWENFTDPKAIMEWNNASDDWHTTNATNDLRVGGKFLSRMEAKDASAGFDFTGTYDQITPYEFIAYTMDDGRQVEITFESTENGVKITQLFEPETENSVEMQQSGWQAILNNFKTFVESQ